MNFNNDVGLVSHCLFTKTNYFLPNSNDLLALIEMERSPAYIFYSTRFSFGKVVQIKARHKFFPFSGIAISFGRRVVGICNNIFKRIKFDLADLGETNLGNDLEDLNFGIFLCKFQFFQDIWNIH